MGSAQLDPLCLVVSLQRWAYLETTLLAQHATGSPSSPSLSSFQSKHLKELIASMKQRRRYYRSRRPVEVKPAIRPIRHIASSRRAFTAINQIKTVCVAIAYRSMESL